MVVSSATFTEIWFPSNAGGGTALTLESEITRQTYSFNFTDLDDTEGYYHICVDFTGVPEGEYVWRIGDDGGIIRIGLYTAPATEYKKNEKHTYYEYGK